MTLPLVFRVIRQGKARFVCAALGVAAAFGAIVFTYSLKTSNDAQAPALARRATAPWQSWKTEGRVGRPRRGAPPTPAADDASAPAKLAPPPADLVLPIVGLTLDYRPGGHVLQGPPMRAVVAPAPAASPYANVSLEGRWPDDTSPALEVVAVKSVLRRFGRGDIPPLGTDLKFVGRRGTMTAVLVGYLDGVRVLPGWPDVFANAAAFDALSAEERGTLSLWRAALDADGVRTVADIADEFATDAGRDFGRAQTLLLWAAALTALCLLVNSLFLSIEASRRQIAVLRTVGLTRAGVARLVLAESLLATATGVAAGGIVAIAALCAFVATDKTMFPTGPALSLPAISWAALGALAVAFAATLLLLKPALSVRPLEAASDAPRPARRRSGMAVVFAFGFGAFIAVEVWGASLMKPFVPSPEWPDAIVSLLPAGVPRSALASLSSIDGVARLAELRPLQIPLFPEEPIRMPGRPAAPGSPLMLRNALLLGSDWLPRFAYAEGSHDEAEVAIASTDACVITAMMSMGLDLHKGDSLALSSGGETVSLPIAGVADLNWHMVTSRGLVRGLNGAPPSTEGPVFVSPGTLEALRAKLAPPAAPRGRTAPQHGVLTPALRATPLSEGGDSRGALRDTEVDETTTVPSAERRNAPQVPSALPPSERGDAPQGQGGVFRARPLPSAPSASATHLWLDYEPGFLAEYGVFPAGRIVEERIREALDDPQSCTVRLHARDEISDGTLAHGSNIIGSMARIPFLFIAVLSLGFVAMLVADTDASKREFAVLRAVGATQGQLATRLVRNALCTALAGMILGLAGGTVVGALSAGATRAAMPWTIPSCFVIPWRPVALGAAIAIAFVAAVAIPTSMALVRKAVRDGLAR